MLLQDDDGDTVATIVKEKREVAKDINREIIQRWLQKKGKKPITWGTLVEVLEAVELNVLAEDIREALGF